MNFQSFKKLGHDIHIFSGPPYPKVPRLSLKKLKTLISLKLLIKRPLKKFLQKGNRDYLDYFNFLSLLSGDSQNENIWGKNC